MASSTPRRLLPTTRTQVSGHKFMRRRVEHGLIFGDIRMIHDPVAARHRAGVFSVVAVCAIAAIMALVAWLKPNPDPGEAPILRGSSGDLYVRVGETIHPVTNLTSARLISGSNENPQRIGDDNLLALPRGVPVGITAAPHHFAPADAADVAWSACTAEEVTVSAGPAPELLNEHAAVLVRADGREWILTSDGRHLLPRAHTPEGRVLRRNLGITSDTPRWTPPPEVLTVATEQPPLTLPTPLPDLVTTAGRSWLVAPSGGIQPVTELQRDMLVDAGSPSREMPGANLAALPDAEPPINIHLPDIAPQWLDPEENTLCVTGTGGGAIMPAEHIAAPMDLSGEAVARSFVGLDSGAVAVDTGHGFHVVSALGTRHLVPDANVLEIIGAQHIESVPWSLISLLPEGPALSSEDAVRAIY